MYNMLVIEPQRIGSLISGDSKDILECGLHGTSVEINRKTSSLSPSSWKKLSVVSTIAVVAGLATVGYVMNGSNSSSKITESSPVIRSSSRVLSGFTPEFNIAIRNDDPSLKISTSGNFLGVNMFNANGPISNPSANPWTNGNIPTTGSPTGLNSFMNVHICTSEEDIQNSLAAEASVSGSYLGASGSLSASASKFSKIDSTSIKTLLVANKWVSDYSFSSPTLQDSVLASAVSNPQSFINNYGTHYVQSIYTGCQLTVDLTTTLSSADKKTSLSAELKAGYSGIVSMDVAGSIQSTAESIDSTASFGVNAVSNIALNYLPKDSSVNELNKMYTQWSTDCNSSNAPVQMISLSSWLNIPAFADKCSQSVDCSNFFNTINQISPTSLNQLTSTRNNLQISSITLQRMITSGYFEAPNGYDFVTDQNICPDSFTQDYVLDNVNNLSNGQNILSQMNSWINNYTSYLHEGNSFTGCVAQEGQDIYDPNVCPGLPKPSNCNGFAHNENGKLICRTCTATNGQDVYDPTVCPQLSTPNSCGGGVINTIKGLQICVVTGGTISDYIKDTADLLNKANSVIDCISAPKAQVTAYSPAKVADINDSTGFETPPGGAWSCEATCATNAGKNLPVDWKGAKCIPSLDSNGVLIPCNKSLETPGSRTCMCERTGNGWATFADINLSTEAISCTQYCSGKSGAPYTTGGSIVLPGSWNGASCAASYYTDEGMIPSSCDYLYNELQTCTCFSNDQGWTQ